MATKPNNTAFHHNYQQQQQNVPFTVKPVVKVKEMDDTMFKFIEDSVRETYEDTKLKMKDEIDVANYLKDKLDDRYRDKDLCWHVIVGKNFGGYVSFQEKIYCYFYVGQTGFMIFATPDV